MQMTISLSQSCAVPRVETSFPYCLLVCTPKSLGLPSTLRSAPPSTASNSQLHFAPICPSFKDLMSHCSWTSSGCQDQLLTSSGRLYPPEQVCEVRSPSFQKLISKHLKSVLHFQEDNMLRDCEITLLLLS